MFWNKKAEQNCRRINKQKKHLMKRKIIFIVQNQDICVKWSTVARTEVCFLLKSRPHRGHTSCLVTISGALAYFSVCGNRKQKTSQADKDVSLAPLHFSRSEIPPALFTWTLNKVQYVIWTGFSQNEPLWHVQQCDFTRNARRRSCLWSCQLNFDLQGAVVHLVVSTLSTMHRRKKNSDQTYEESSKRYLFSWRALRPRSGRVCDGDTGHRGTKPTPRSKWNYFPKRVFRIRIFQLAFFDHVNATF